MTTHLDCWVSLSGVVAFLSGNASSRPPLTLVPKPHPPLLRLLNNLYAGGCLGKQKHCVLIVQHCFTRINVSTQTKPGHRLSLHQRVEMFTHEILADNISNDFKKGNCSYSG